MNIYQNRYYNRLILPLLVHIFKKNRNNSDFILPKTHFLSNMRFCIFSPLIHYATLCLSNDLVHRQDTPPDIGKNTKKFFHYIKNLSWCIVITQLKYSQEFHQFEITNSKRANVYKPFFLFRLYSKTLKQQTILTFWKLFFFALWGGFTLDNITL